jgi:hypothetical protein
MNGSYWLITTVFAAAFLAGAVFALPAILATSLTNHLQLSEGRRRTLRSLWFLLLVPMMLVSGLLIDKLGVQTVLLTGALLAALALVVVERAASQGSALGAMLLFAGASAALMTGSLIAMPQAIFPDRPARSINLGSLAIVLGILWTPALLGMLTKRLEPRKALLLLALVCLVPAAAAACTPPAEMPHSNRTVDWTHLFADYRLGLLALLVFLAFPLEAALAGWVKRYVAELRYLPGSTAVLWCGFWLAFLGARLATGLLLPAGGEAVLVLVLAMVATVTLGHMLSEYASGSAGLWLIGACCGPLVPTLLGLVLKLYPAAAGAALGLVNGAGALSALALLPFMESSTRPALRWSTLLALVLMAPALVLVLLQ